eukprot:gene10522-449_t
MRRATWEFVFVLTQMCCPRRVKDKNAIELYKSSRVQ